MENFMKMLSTQAILLVYMAVGFYCRKRGIIEKKMQGKLTDFVLRITLPCMIFNSFSMHITLDMLKQAALCLGVAFFICFAAWLGGKVVYNMYPKEKKSVLQYATLVNNAAFLGLPIVKAVLGEVSLPPTMWRNNEDGTIKNVECEGWIRYADDRVNGEVLTNETSQ